MKPIKLKYFCAGLGLFLASCNQSAEEMSTTYADIELDAKGFISQITDKRSGKNYLTEQNASPLITLFDGNKYIMPISARLEGNEYIITFENQSEAVVTREVKKDYLRLTLKSLTNREGIQAVAWGPYATNLSQHIGETVGVVRDTTFSVGVQALDVFTTEGRPHEGDYLGGRFVIDPLPGQTLPDELKDKIGQDAGPINVNKEGDMPAYVRMYRGKAAVKQEYGSDIQFFARDWTKSRVVELGRGKNVRKQFVDAVDQDFIGSSIALFGAPSAKALDVIGNIEMNEDLPHPLWDGEWIKTRKHSNPAYMLYDGRDLDKALDYADSCNFDLIHIGSIFKNWGHFDLHTKGFPNGAVDVKAFTDKAKARGKSIGIHTLSMFTTTDDPYVSPVPSDSLAIAGTSVLTKDVSETATEIEIESPEFFKFADVTHTVKIGKELIYYREVSKEAPYKLLDCTRGKYGTKVSAHKTGEKVEKLVNNCYASFYPNYYLQDKYADRYAEICKETGIGLIDFDGLIDGGGVATGHGVFGSGRFIERWHKNIDKFYIACGSATFHYFWHLYIFMNWGEPWYDNLRQSQVNYRLENQRYFERNLMPGMLGWFKLEQTYRPEDIEWIQARSAAFDAGYLLRVGEGIEVNGFKSQLFQAIREWQKVRKLNLFTSAQRERMKNPLNEFHLEKTGENSWNLYSVALKGGNQHKYRAAQTGEPLVSKFEFKNPYKKQPVQFFAKIMKAEDKTATIKNLKLEVDGNVIVEIPQALKVNDRVYCDGKKVYVCDKFWKKIKEYAIPSSCLWNEGNNEISVQCDFSNAEAPLVDLEFKALGNPEVVKK